MEVEKAEVRIPLLIHVRHARNDINTQAPSKNTQTAIAHQHHATMAAAAKKKLVVCGGNGFLGTSKP
jgi:hypothetical protein